MQPTDSEKKGQVIWFDDKLGAGFLREQGGRYIYIHYKDINLLGHRTLLRAERVAFDSIKSPSGARASNITPHGLFRPWRYIKNGIARRFAKIMMKRRSVRFMWTIRSGRPVVNMIRYYLLKTPWFELYLHQFMDTDDPLYHDHPWNFYTLIVRGGYHEEMPQSSRLLSPGRLIYRRADHIHRVVIPDTLRGKVWTLVLTGRRFHAWRFFDRQSLLPYTPQELAERRGAELRIDHDFNFSGFFLPRMSRGTRPPRMHRL